MSKLSTQRPSQLDPEVAVLLSELPVNAPPISETKPDDLRRNFANLMKLLHPGQPKPFAGRVTDELIHSVPVRSYMPAEVQSSDVVVFFHGGGWVLGGKDSAEPGAIALADTLGVRVVSVDYRLAPEHPHPAAFTDCLTVARQLADSGPRWLGVAGDSAGGSLAAAVSLSARANGFKVDAQMLLYPAIDPEMSASSYVEFAEGYSLTAEAMDFYWRAHQGDTDGTDRMFALCLASLEEAPPTILATAGFDPLRDEGAAFAARLVTSGVATTYLPFPSLIHGWLDQTDRVRAASAARDQTIAAFAELRNRQLAN